METEQGNGRFVDEAEKIIAPRNTWHELTVSQLIEVQVQLENNRYAFAKNPAIAKSLDSGIMELQSLIASRSS